MPETDFHVSECLLLAIICISLSFKICILHFFADEIKRDVIKDVDNMKRVFKCIWGSIVKLFTGQNPNIPREPPPKHPE